MIDPSRRRGRPERGQRSRPRPCLKPPLPGLICPPRRAHRL